MVPHREHLRADGLLVRWRYTTSAAVRPVSQPRCGCAVCDWAGTQSMDHAVQPRELIYAHSSTSMWKTSVRTSNDSGRKILLSHDTTSTKRFATFCADLELTVVMCTYASLEGAKVSEQLTFRHITVHNLAAASPCSDPEHVQQAQQILISHPAACRIATDMHQHTSRTGGSALYEYTTQNYILSRKKAIYEKNIHELA